MAGEEERQEKIVNWFSKTENLLLSVLIAFTVIIKLYYFFKVGEQPIWWDEGDYLAIAKVWVIGMATPEWWGHFANLRPLFLPLIWTLFFKFGLGEMSIRFITLLLPSIGTIFVTYLLGRDLYNKYVGLIAGFMMSCYWVWGFYSYRLLTDIPAVFFGTLCLYYFWGRYWKNKENKGLYLSILFGVLAFSTRFPLALVLISCALFLVLVKRAELIKDRTIWKGAVWGAICLLPYIIYFIASKFFALKFYFLSPVRESAPIGWNLIPMLFSLPKSIWMIALIIGVLSLYPVIFYGDLIFKRKTNEFDSDLFVAIFLLVHVIFYVFILKLGNDRWLLMLMPALFIVAGNGLIKIYDYIKKYNKMLALIAILIIIFWGAWQNLTYAHDLTISKKDSYLQVKEAGLWLKENTPVDSKIITASIVQNQYYSERESYDYNYNNSMMPKDCIDKFGATNTNFTCQEASENLFELKKTEIKPDYFIASVFEPVFTPAWVYTYGERNNLTAVQAYVDANRNPLLIVYKL